MDASIRFSTFQTFSVWISALPCRHFELTAQELGLSGSWLVKQVEIEIPDERMEYEVTWSTE